MRLYYLWFELKSCMITKGKLEQIKTLDECQNYLRCELVKYKTLFNKTYTDYEEKSFTEQVKAYECEGNYVIVCSNLEGLNVKNMKIYLTKTKPTKPHPLFPVPMGFIKNAKEFEFGDDLLDKGNLNIDDCVNAMKQKQNSCNC